MPKEKRPEKEEIEPAIAPVKKLSRGLTKLKFMNKHEKIIEDDEIVDQDPNFWVNPDYSAKDKVESNVTIEEQDPYLLMLQSSGRKRFGDKPKAKKVPDFEDVKVPGTDKKRTQRFFEPPKKEVRK